MDLSYIDTQTSAWFQEIKAIINLPSLLLLLLLLLLWLGRLSPASASKAEAAVATAK